jgi:Family of unknown function (DUF5681)
MADDEEDYPVGYKKPPAHSRFKPGQSGNPKGRPKKVGPSISEAFWKELNSPVTLTEKGGKSRKISLLQAIAKKQAKRAFEGDIKSTELVFKAAALGGADAARGLADLIGALDTKHESHEVIDAEVIRKQVTDGEGDAEN